MYERMYGRGSPWDTFDPTPSPGEVLLAREIIKRDKLERKKKRNEEKKKEEKKKPRQFTFLETVGLVLLFSTALPHIQNAIELLITNLNVPH